jgi:hypothetical protein
MIRALGRGQDEVDFAHALPDTGKIMCCDIAGKELRFREVVLVDILGKRPLVKGCGNMHACGSGPPAASPTTTE